MSTLQVITLVVIIGIFALALFSFVKSLIKFIKLKKSNKLEKEEEPSDSITN